MACGYISTNENRLYVGRELNYAQAPSIDSTNRFPAVKLATTQRLERPERKDKTGTRTFPGSPAGLRRKTTYDLTTYMTGWTRQDAAPGYGPLFQASLGDAGMLYPGGTAGINTDPKTLVFQGQHGLTAGQAVTVNGELRFVTSIINGVEVELNAPLSALPYEGTLVGPTMTYAPTTNLATVSIFDYWSPTGVVQRILSGAWVNQMRVKVNADYHEFQFAGGARDVIDTTSFETGQGELTEFPTEPPIDLFDYTIIPGHLGQAWLGNTPDRFYTITEAELLLDNDVDSRNLEFGSDGPRCISGGQRTVTVDFSLFELNDEATKGLYQAARQTSPIAIMLQLGQQEGQLFGAYMKGVIPEVPDFEDGDRRLEWKFTGNQAQGVGDDEIFVAFG
jgi:hypothetical protein